MKPLDLTEPGISRKPQNQTRNTVSPASGAVALTLVANGADIQQWKEAGLSTLAAIDVNGNGLFAGATMNSLSGTGVRLVTSAADGELSNNTAIDGDYTFAGTLTFTLAPILTALTASLPVFTDASKNLVSNPMSGSGSVMMSASPTTTGTLTGAAAVFSGNVTIGATYTLSTSGATTTGYTETTDGADTSQLILRGGGSSGGAASRGASLILAGNENPNVGRITLSAGTVTGGEIRFLTSGTLRVTVTETGPVTFGTASPLTLSSVTDSTTTSTGALIVSGGVGIAKAVFIGTTLGVAGNLTNTILAGTGTRMVTATSTGLLGNATTISGANTWSDVQTFTSQPVYSSLTASRAVFTDGSKGLVSNAISGSGNVLMSASPTTTGTLTADAANFSGAVSTGALTATTGQFSSTFRIGGAPGATIALRVNGAVLTGTTQVNALFDGPFNSGATVRANSLGLNFGTDAAAFTMVDGMALRIGSPSVGAGSAVTNLYGIKIENHSGGGTTWSLHTGTGLVHFGGAVDMSSTLALTSDFAINTNKFTVAASSGNTLVAGTLQVTSTSAFGATVTLTNAQANYAATSTTASNPSFLTLTANGSAAQVSHAGSVGTDFMTGGSAGALQLIAAALIEFGIGGAKVFSLAATNAIFLQEVRFAAGNTVSASVLNVVTTKIKLNVNGTDYYLLASTSNA